MFLRNQSNNNYLIVSIDSCKFLQSLPLPSLTDICLLAYSLSCLFTVNPVQGYRYDFNCELRWNIVEK